MNVPDGVVDFMRHPRGQLPDRGQLLGLHQLLLRLGELLLHPLALGDIHERLDGPNNATARIVQ